MPLFIGVSFLSYVTITLIMVIKSIFPFFKIMCNVNASTNNNNNSNSSLFWVSYAEFTYNISFNSQILGVGTVFNYG